MLNVALFRRAGWSAIASAILTILGWCLATMPMPVGHYHRAWWGWALSPEQVMC